MLFSWYRRVATNKAAEKTGRRRSRARGRPWVEVLESRDLPSVALPTYVRLNSHGTVHPLGDPGPNGYSPDQIRHAYGIDQITFPGNVTGDGSGQTIAIVDAFDDPKFLNSSDPNFATSDLHGFDTQFKLPEPTGFFTKINQSGGNTMPPPDPGWSQEIALDVEWAHAIAPQAKIVLVEANDNSFQNLLTAVDTAANLSGVVAVSMSWGGGEFPGENAYDSNFLTPTGHAGVTFLAASGDSGAPPIYPAVAPDVVACGGTTLNLDGNNNISSESGWVGSGGGISSVEPQPSYQNGVVSQTSTARASPDVAYDADPNTGFPVYETMNNAPSAPWSTFGGTSDAAPQWAALIAIADQGRHVVGSQPLDGVNDTLPALYTLQSDFNDITTGRSFGFPSYPAGPGYDLVTGLGTPIANKLVPDLAGINSTPATPVSLGITTSLGSTNTATAGAPFSITVEALDANNHLVTNYTGKVHFTSSDPNAGLPADYQFVAGDKGAHTFTNVTLVQLGSDTISAKDNSATPLTGSTTVTVTPAPASFGITTSLGSSNSTTAGSAFTVTVTALDANGHTVTNYTGTVHFTSTDKQALLPADYPFTTGTGADNGVHTFSVTLKTVGSGTQTVTVTDKAKSTLTGSTTVTVTPGATSTFLVTGFPSPTTAGNAGNFTVTAEDAYGNPNPGYTGTVHFTSSDKQAGLPADSPLTKGTGQFSATLKTAGPQSLTATDTVTHSTTGSQTGITVNAAAAAQLVFGQQPTNTPAGSFITPAVTVQVLDAYKNLVGTDNTDQVTLAIGANPGSSTLSGTNPVTVKGGVATFSNLSLNKPANGYTLVASSGKLTGATSNTFNITVPGAVTIIEDFEGPPFHTYYTTPYVNYSIIPQAHHDGQLGLYNQGGFGPNPIGWMYRTDAAAQIQQGEVISVWLQFPKVADGRAYFGFGASSGGTLSIVAAPNTNQLILQDNAGWNYTDIGDVNQTYLANHWYRMEVTWAVGGKITGKLYDSDGKTLLNTVTATDNSITKGGIAFRAIYSGKYFDTVTETQIVSGSVVVGGGGSGRPAGAGGAAGASPRGNGPTFVPPVPQLPVPVAVDTFFAAAQAVVASNDQSGAQNPYGFFDHTTRHHLRWLAAPGHTGHHPGTHHRPGPVGVG
jgi:hypothetical protein